ncbi:equilibrative nucleobase transporter 1-like [Liolophura sinensis]|uniref:equilibrative nucleobase transporter 1-like n=1 Tax=Liolophura sinensis TaxID=3198878 RepID=UPI0031585167
MATLCVKKYVMFVWGLLECLLFSGVVFGWDWLIQILKYDGYFSSFCNGTNLTEIGLSTPSVDLATLGALISARTQPPSDSKERNLPGKSVNGTVSALDGIYLDGIPTTNGPAQNGSPASPHSPYVRYFGNYTDCQEQEDQFAVIYCSMYFAMNSLTLLAGVFFDKYGTMRTRLVAVLLFTVSTLMMTFSSPGVPWLVVPALSLVALGGNMILMTNLQVANLLSSRRYTVMATYVGAHDSSAIIVLFMKLSHIGNINVQTSFMFLTISIVPLLVSTIAFLPKIRIPWPLPANYGKKRGVQVDELVLRQQQMAWQRKMSGANSKSKLKGKPHFRSTAMTSIYICSLLWFSIHRTKSVFYSKNLRTIIKSYGADEYTARTHEDYNTVVQMLGIFCAPFIGLVMDRQGVPVQGSSPYVRQMQNVMAAVFLTTFVSVLLNILSSAPLLDVQIGVFLLALILRVFTVATTAAFLTHVHFPQEHFGKLYGLTTFVAAMFGICLYPLRYALLYKLDGNPFYINVAFLCLSFLAFVHPVNIWRHCRNGWIRDMSASEMERRRKSSCADLLLAKQQLQQGSGKDMTDGSMQLLPSPSRSHGSQTVCELQPSPSKSHDNITTSTQSPTWSKQSPKRHSEAHITPTKTPEVVLTTVGCSDADIRGGDDHVDDTDL